MSQTKAQLVAGLNLNVSAPASALTVDSTGLVGIGTTSPSYLLDVRANNTTIEYPLALTNTATSGTTLAVGQLFRVYTGSAVGNCGSVFATGSSWSFSNYAANSINLVGSSTGGVGIRAANAPIVFYNGNVSADSSTERARIDSSGRLLVGTSSASAISKFIVQGYVGGSDGFMSVRRGATGGDNQRIGAILFDDSSENVAARIDVFGDGVWGTNDYPGRLVFSTTADGASSPTERMRITKDGEIRITQSSTGLTCINTGPNGTALIYFQTASAELGKIRINGAGVAYDTTSDYRLKENIKPITDAVSRLQALKPWRFNFISHPGVTVDGFLAHEAQEVVPEAVGGTKDEVDDDGNPVYQGIDQSKLVPLLTAALQEAIAKIESLEARLDAANI